MKLDTPLNNLEEVKLIDILTPEEYAEYCELTWNDEWEDYWDNGDEED